MTPLESAMAHYYDDMERAALHAVDTIDYMLAERAALTAYDDAVAAVTAGETA